MKKIFSGALFTRNMVRLMAIALAAVMLLGNLQIYAASKKNTKVTDSESLTKVLNNSKVQKITLKTSKKVTLTIPDISGTQKKQLIISAPKAEIINCAKFKTVTINEVGSYREEASGNSITINAKADKKIDIILTKKTKLIVKGEVSSRTNIVSKAKGSTVTAYAPVDINVSKNMTVKLENGSEGSTIDKSKKSIKVKLKNKSGSDPVIKVAGKAATQDQNSKNESDNQYNDKDIYGESINSEGIYLSYNAGQNNYLTYGKTIKSYLFKEDGFFWRVEAENGNDYYSRTAYDEAHKSEKYVYIEKYDSSWKLKDTKKLSYDSSLIWGGFYHGQKYNFVILGDVNDAEDDNKMVVRVIKYDKNWNELGSVDLNGSNTTEPFLAGSLRCVEKDGYLFILTAHQMYTYFDGLRHQSNMIFSVDEEKMIIPYAGYDFQPGYVSHSFNQYIIVNEFGQLVTIDHGDGFPRAMLMSILENENGKITDKDYGDRNILFPLKGAYGVNATGASLGGIEETTEGYMVALNCDEQYYYANNLSTITVCYDLSVGELSRNLYLEFISKKTSDNPSNMSGVRIDYSQDGTIFASTPIVVSIGADKGGYVFWEEYDMAKDMLKIENQKVCYIKYDIDGTVSDIYAFNGKLSDCKPIFDNGSIYWYVTGASELSEHPFVQSVNGKEYRSDYDTVKTVPCLYSINTKTGEIKRRIAGGKEIDISVSNIKKEKSSFIKGAVDLYNEKILFGKDTLDKSGKVIETEYFDDEAVLRGKAEYEYDKQGVLKQKKFFVPDNDSISFEFVYYPDGKTLKSKGIIKLSDMDSNVGVVKRREETCYEFYQDGKIKNEKVATTDLDEKGAVYNQNTTETEYLEDGQISEVWYYNSDKDSGLRQRYIYEDGLEKQYVLYYSDGKSASEFYDETGRVIKSVYDGGTERSNETLYEYDPEGNKIKEEIKYSDGYTYIYEYYSDGRTKSCEVRGNDGSVRIDKYEYDDKGNLVRVERQ